MPARASLRMLAIVVLRTCKPPLGHLIPRGLFNEIAPGPSHSLTLCRVTPEFL
jgi:hypothetical protein